MITSKKWGKLGNQLFIISALLGVSKRDKVDCYMPSWAYESVFPNLRKYIKNSVNMPNTWMKEYKEPFFHYNPIPSGDVIIDGYFQSEKYFNGADIKDAFKMNINFDSSVSNMTSIHIRRGDYLKSNGFHPPISMEYLNKAMDMIGGAFAVFSDDMDWAKKNLNRDNLTFIHSEKDFEDLYLMTTCKNNIIANSSFSWWGAYLNPNPNKQVIAPSNWFGDKTMNTNDLYCAGWEVI